MDKNAISDMMTKGNDGGQSKAKQEVLGYIWDYSSNGYAFLGKNYPQVCHNPSFEAHIRTMNAS